MKSTPYAFGAQLHPNTLDECCDLGNDRNASGRRLSPAGGLVLGVVLGGLLWLLIAWAAYLHIVA